MSNFAYLPTLTQGRQTITLTAAFGLYSVYTIINSTYNYFILLYYLLKTHARVLSKLVSFCISNDPTVVACF